MSLAEYAVGVARLGLLLIPAVVGSRFARSAFLPVPTRSLGLLVDVILVTSVLIIGSEVLGILDLDRWWALTSLLWLAGGTTVAVVRRGRPHRNTPVADATPALGPPPRPDEPPSRSAEPTLVSRRVQLMVAGVSMAVVWAQWALLTSDAYGGGILSFDSLWYHLPLSAFFAQTGSVSRVLFTQADPFVAYYPANSELLHGLGLIAMRSDLLSPGLNLVWLAVALLAAWCFGRRWRIEPITLTAGCLIMGVPILGAGQAGSAFNDIFGLAFLMAGFALFVQGSRRPDMLVPCGLALGLALGTKVTFAAPAIVVVCGAHLASPAGQRLRALFCLGIPCILTGGWWYLRATVDTGSPLGLRVHIGPIVLPGPSSPLANAASQTVISALGKPHLWGSRLAAGLNYALGPLWPVLVLGAASGLIGGLALTRVPAAIRVVAVAGVVSVLAYLVFPTGASAIEEQAQLFAVNLRYATPAVAIGLLLVVALVAERFPCFRTALALLVLAMLLVTQFQAQLWPRQTARHAAFLLAAMLMVIAVTAAGRLRRDSMGLRASVAGASVICVLAGFAVERHYFSRRYLSAVDSATPLGQIYRWAQRISDARVAVYGSVEQYPLYGARVTNRVDYLGETGRDGGYAPIATCSAWRAVLRRGGFQYLVISPAPTAGVVPAWTAGDAAATLILHPAPGYSVYRLNRSMASTHC